MNSSGYPSSVKGTEHVSEEMVACSVCLSEIPQSSAKSDESSDYVAHFCGLDCFEKWREGESAD
ncbi:MAG: DUF3330 domain-containing protein [Gammaproteobacteria bacterium]|nr:DUF3330 domain-containing protein [Gammaproteobacteria bacterium]